MEMKCFFPFADKCR